MLRGARTTKLALAVSGFPEEEGVSKTVSVEREQNGRDSFPSQPDRAGRTGDTEFSLLTWNIDHWPVLGWGRRGREDIDVVRSLIADFDIVCLQECWSTVGTGLRQAFPYHYRDGKRTWVGFGSGLLILSKYPVSGGSFKRYRGRVLPDSLAAKGVSLARISLGKFGEIDIINTHLQKWRGQKVRSRQVRELEAFIRRTAKSPVAVLAGDLNIGCDSREYRQLARAFRLRDVFRERPVRTQPGCSVRPGGSNERIDHLFLMSRRKEVAQILDTGVIPSGVARVRCPSDHHGLYVRLRLKKQELA